MFKFIKKIYDKIPGIKKLYNLNIRQKYFAILIGIILLYLYLYIAGLPDENNTFTVCLFKNITGYPCPACGTTRGMKLLVRGYFKQSILMNPLSLLTIIVSIVSFIWIIIDLIKKKETFFPFVNQKVPFWFIIIIIILTISNWIWNIYKGI